MPNGRPSGPRLHTDHELRASQSPRVFWSYTVARMAAAPCWLSLRVAMDYLLRDGVALAYEDVGKGAPPILLIHDLGQDHCSLLPHLEHFRREHRVIAVDLRGHGHSDPFAQPCTTADFAADIAWLIYQLGVYRPVAIGRGSAR
jgi:alpha/beta hydrolase fold